MTDSPMSRMTASEFVAETLRNEILRGDLLPGQPLLQDHIASRFAVSQSSVREALRRLEALTLVYSLRNRGAFVTGLTVDQVEEIYDLRLAIELMALRRKFPLLTDDDIAQAERLLELMDSSDHIGIAGDTHKKFHSLFFETPGRTFASDMLRNLYGNLTRVWMAMVKKQPSSARKFQEEARREHRELLDAARRRDLAEAERVLVAHIGQAREQLVSHLREGATGTSAPAPPSEARSARRPARSTA